MDAKVVHDLPVSKELNEEEIFKKAKLDIDDYPSKNWGPDEVEKRYPRKDRVMMYIEKLTKEGRVLFGTDADEECDDGCYSQELFEFASYQLDMIEHDGFDFSVLPNGMEEEPLPVVPLHHPPNLVTDPKMFEELTDCARMAINALDLKNDTHFDKDTHFDNVRVLKANVDVMDPVRYYITFEATDERKNLTETFQARVNVMSPEATEATMREVELIRIKPPFKPLPLLNIIPPLA